MHIRDSQLNYSNPHIYKDHYWFGVSGARLLNMNPRTRCQCLCSIIGSRTTGFRNAHIRDGDDPHQPSPEPSLPIIPSVTGIFDLCDDGDVILAENKSLQKE